MGIMKMRISGVFSVFLSNVDASCFDGNNGGCSHICSGSICSCPPCWTLNEDEKNCEITNGKARVTCRNDGMDVVIDKCVAVDVEQSSIHLRNSDCGAIEESDSEWKVSTGFSDCGTEITFVDNKLAIANTLMIGGAVVGGLRLTNNYEIGFTCRYNNAATASKSFSAQAETVVFGINEEAPTELSFGFNLQPYESDQFTTTTDLATQSVQIGSSIYMRVSPAIELPNSLEFSVHKCSVEETISQTEVTILDSCPLFPGLNFSFKNEQSDQNAVDFSFASFQFQSSEEIAEIELTCEINICPSNLAECLLPCSETATTPESNIHIMFIKSLSSSFMINGDGSRRSGVQLTFPNDISDYTLYAQPAVVAGQLHLFGGLSEYRKIARLEGCAIVELSARLTSDSSGSHAALAIGNGSKALICFGRTSNCDVFDGSTVVETFSSSYPHRYVGLGFYNNQPTTVGNVNAEGAGKVETLGPNGWTSLPDQQTYTYAHALVGLSNGDLLVIGGNNGADVLDTVWRLSSGIWTLGGNLQQPVYYGAAIMNGNSVYSFAGYNAIGGFPIERLDLADDGTIEQAVHIGDLDTISFKPILFITDVNTCSTT